MKENIIITGAYGQDGLILSQILKRFRFNVIGIVKKIDKKRGFNNIKYTSINLLKKPETIDFLKKIKIKSIVHFASNNEAYIKKSNLSYEKYYRQNYIITKNLIESIIEINRDIQFIFAGSSQMFKSNKKNNLITINSQYQKSNSHYINYKIDSEKLLLNLKKKFKLKITSAILFNHDSKYRSDNFLIKRIINNAKKRNTKFLKDIYQSNIKGDFSHAEDINFAIYLIIKNNSNFDRIILSSNKVTKINDFILNVLKKFNIKMSFNNVKVIKNNKFKIGYNKITISKLDWKPKKNLCHVINEIR